jgi:hypothetical protein
LGAVVVPLVGATNGPIIGFRFGIGVGVGAIGVGEGNDSGGGVEVLEGCCAMSTPQTNNKNISTAAIFIIGIYTNR